MRSIGYGLLEHHVVSGMERLGQSAISSLLDLHLRLDRHRVFPFTFCKERCWRVFPFSSRLYSSRSSSVFLFFSVISLFVAVPVLLSMVFGITSISSIRNWASTEGGSFCPDANLGLASVVI
jgi:hypothetical protein